MWMVLLSELVSEGKGVLAILLNTQNLVLCRRSIIVKCFGPVKVALHGFFPLNLQFYLNSSLYFLDLLPSFFFCLLQTNLFSIYLSIYFAEKIPKFFAKWLDSC